MAIFTFDPPALAGASPLARRKSLLGWLRGRLAARGVEALGPAADAGGWRLTVPGDEGFVTLRLAAEGERMRLSVQSQGEAEAEYEETVAACEDALRAAALESDACA